MIFWSQYRKHSGRWLTYLQVAWEKVLHERNRPLLKRFGKDGVVGVTKGLLHDYTLSALDALIMFRVLTAPCVIPL